MRVLIADDQRDVGKSLAELVRYCNHEVVAVVGSGLEAINAYSLHHPDLVLMDYRMPKLNGGTASRHIIAKDPAARIILVTAWSPSDEASQLGAIAILPKPVDLERLNATLQTVAQMLPVPSPAEMLFPEVSYQTEAIDYLQPVAEPLPAVPPSLEMPIPEVRYQPEAIDYFPPVAEPLPVVPPSLEMPIQEVRYQPESIDYFPSITQPLPAVPPSLETSFPVEAPQNCLQQTAEACALDDEKIPGKRRSSRRRAQRPRAR
jgi:two-component system, chemotaxis family, chemotaxis protein CheY